MNINNVMTFDQYEAQMKAIGAQAQCIIAQLEEKDQLIRQAMPVIDEMFNMVVFYIVVRQIHFAKAGLKLICEVIEQFENEIESVKALNCKIKFLDQQKDKVHNQWKSRLFR